MIVSTIHRFLMDFKYWFNRIFYKKKYHAHAVIEGKDFTLFYDYDQIRDKKLTQLTPDGKIEWFHLRMEAVFLEPLRRIFNQKSVAHRELDSRSSYDRPIRAVMIAAFSILLNGIEALGSFIVEDPKKSKRDNFYTFIKNYMDDWNIDVLGTTYQTRYGIVYLPKILWKYFRNGIAHGFVIEDGGGIEHIIKDKKKTEKNGRLEICPIAFFKDFEVGVKKFLDDIKDIRSSKRTYFLLRFQDLYRC